jgi:hypothetical protein
LTPAQPFVRLRFDMWTIVILVVVVIGLLALVGWHARTFAYRCRSCGNEFDIPMLMDFISPHGPGRGGGWKLLRCPKCGRWTRAFVIRKSEMRSG